MKLILHEPEIKNLYTMIYLRLKGSMLIQCRKLLKLDFASGAPDVLLHRLPEFIRLFLSDGLLPDLVYVLGLKTV